MDRYLIDDKRTLFTNITFSNYQKSKVRTELLKCIYDSRVENSIYWSAELICSGHYIDLWDIIILYYVKYIHISNPKLSIYISMRFNNFKTIIENGYTNNILSMRNNSKIRKLFGEVICVLCYSQKRPAIETFKINKQTDYDLTKLQERLTAPNINYINPIYKDDDPKELFIPVNELIYAVETNNQINIFYWIEWILEYELRLKKEHKNCIAETRLYAPTEFRHDIIWIIWDIIFYYCKNNTLLQSHYIKFTNDTQKALKLKIISNLLELFIIRYNSNVKRRRKLILYFAFNLLFEIIDVNTVIINDEIKKHINVIIPKIDLIYKQIKQNEISSNTDYLFKDIKQQNLERSINKLEKMEQILQ